MQTEDIKHATVCESSFLSPAGGGHHLLTATARPRRPSPTEQQARQIARCSTGIRRSCMQYQTKHQRRAEHVCGTSLQEASTPRQPRPDGIVISSKLVTKRQARTFNLGTSSSKPVACSVLQLPAWPTSITYTAPRSVSTMPEKAQQSKL